MGISEFFNDQAGDRNREGSLGALAILKGSNHLLLSTIDPHPESTTGNNINTYWYTQGTHTVNLVCADTTVANAITDSNGTYLFSNDTEGVSTNSQKFNISQLVENNTTYICK